jgi:hypothetical protein
MSRVSGALLEKMETMKADRNLRLMSDMGESLFRKTRTNSTSVSVM